MEILNTVYYGVVPIKLAVVLSIVCFIAFIIMSICYAWEFNKAGSVFSILCLFCFVTIVVLGIVNSCVKSDKVNYYEATIDDSVKVSDFSTKYEIIDQKGKIYKIRERK